MIAFLRKSLLVGLSALLFLEGLPASERRATPRFAEQALIPIALSFRQRLRTHMEAAPFLSINLTSYRAQQPPEASVIEILENRYRPCLIGATIVVAVVVAVLYPGSLLADAFFIIQMAIHSNPDGGGSNILREQELAALEPEALALYNTAPAEDLTEILRTGMSNPTAAAWVRRRGPAPAQFQSFEAIAQAAGEDQSPNLKQATAQGLRLILASYVEARRRPVNPANERVLQFFNNAGREGWPPLVSLFGDSAILTLPDIAKLELVRIDRRESHKGVFKTLADLRAGLEMRFTRARIDRVMDEIMTLRTRPIPAEAVAPQAHRKKDRGNLLVPSEVADFPEPGAGPAAPPDPPAPAIEVEDSAATPPSPFDSIVTTYGEIDFPGVLRFFTHASVADLAVACGYFLGDKIEALAGLQRRKQGSWRDGVEILYALEDLYDFNLKRITRILSVAARSLALCTILEDPRFEYQVEPGENSQVVRLSLRERAAGQPRRHALNLRYEPSDRTLYLDGLDSPPEAPGEHVMNSLLLAGMLLHYQHERTQPAVRLVIPAARLREMEALWVSRLETPTFCPDLRFVEKPGEAEYYEGSLEWDWTSESEAILALSGEQAGVALQFGAAFASDFMAMKALPHFSVHVLQAPGAPMPLLWIELARASGSGRGHGVFALVPKRPRDSVAWGLPARALWVEGMDDGVSGWPASMAGFILRTRGSRSFEITRLESRISVRTFSVRDYVAAWASYAAIQKGLPASQALAEAAEKHAARFEDVAHAMARLDLKTRSDIRGIILNYNLDRKRSAPRAIPPEIPAARGSASPVSPPASEPTPAPSPQPAAPPEPLVRPADREKPKPERIPFTPRHRESPRPAIEPTPFTPAVRPAPSIQEATFAPPVTPSAPPRPTRPAPEVTRAERYENEILRHAGSLRRLFEFLGPRLAAASAELEDTLAAMRRPRMHAILREMGLAFAESEPATLEAVLKVHPGTRLLFGIWSLKDEERAQFRLLETLGLLRTLPPAAEVPARFQDALRLAEPLASPWTRQTQDLATIRTPIKEAGLPGNKDGKNFYVYFKQLHPSAHAFWKLAGFEKQFEEVFFRDFRFWESALSFVEVYDIFVTMKNAPPPSGFAGRLRQALRWIKREFLIGINHYPGNPARFAPRMRAPA